MLSDEEKAIEELKNKKADYFMISNLTGKTLLNLIEKQSKEIEELINEVMEKELIIDGMKEDRRIADKIKAEIKELQNMKVGGELFTTAVNFAIKEMQSLLEKE